MSHEKKPQGLDTALTVKYYDDNFNSKKRRKRGDDGGAMKSSKTKYLRSAGQIKAICSDVRMRIVQSFRDGETTVARIAARLGRTPHSLYHHMRQLEDAGIVRSAGRRRSGKRDETIYALTADTFQIHHDPGSAESRRALTRAARAVLRLTARDAAKSIGRGLIVKHGQRRNTDIHRSDVRLTRAQVRRVLKHCRAIEDILAEAEGSATGHPFSFTCLFFPLVR
jgi:DNA-binding transcriptional ArsR family regulator